MTYRQLTLKRGVYDLKKWGKDVRIFFTSPMNLITGSFPAFKIDSCLGIMKGCAKDTETDFEIICITLITLMAQCIKDNNDMKLHYTFLTEEFLPEMWKDRKGIELKRQRKLENLAKLLDKDERYQEAHVIRIIVKPHLEEMNRKWTNMTALEKFKSCFHNFLYKL